jgi:acetyltransferase-like isoleucine patch superfamily enzyme
MIEHLLKHMGRNLTIAETVEIWNPDNIEIGDDVYIGSHTMLIGYYNAAGGISIGDRSWIGPNCYLNGAGRIQIGNDVGIGPGVMILTSQHSGNPKRIPIKDTQLKFGQVVIEDGADIGMGSKILPGITIGRNAQVGAGAIVTRDVKCYSTVAGNPAREI